MSRWRLVGLGVLAAVAVAGAAGAVVVARPLRTVIDVDDEELSRRLHAFHARHRAPD